MNDHHSPRGGRLLSGILVLAGMVSPAFADPKIPRGSLNVDRALVRTGTQAQLQWDIQYPEKITGSVEILEPHVLKARKDLKMRVRVLGSSFQKVKNNNGNGNNVDGVDSSNPGKGGSKTVDLSAGVDDEIGGSITSTGEQDVPVELVWAKNGSAWTRVFYGFQREIVPTAIVLNTQLATGDTVDFGGRAYLNGWLPLYETSSNTPNIVLLKDGDPIPDFITSYKMGLIKGFLKAYLSSDLKTLKLGESDFIVLMELDESNSSQPGFDLQDLAVLVTFE